MSLAIRNVRLVDGTGAAPLKDMTVEVERGTVSWIGPSTTPHRKGLHAEEINGHGLTLIPGLIDCHEHFTGDGGLDNGARLADDAPEAATLKAVGNARRALLSGVTSARDVGSRGGINIPFAQAVAAGNVLGPRIIAAGEWLAFAGTWGTFARTMSSLEEMVLAIKDQVARGAGLIKVGATGTTHDGRQTATLGPQVLEAAVRTAHEAGLKIAAHCTGYEGSRQAVEAGVDSIEHGFYLDDATVRLMAQKGTYLVPTMSTWDERLRIGRMLGEDAKALAAAEERAAESRASFKRALRAGVKVAAGSDAGGSAARHGMLAREVELMVENGLPPSKALQAATYEAATLLGIQDVAGTIEVGKAADLVLIDGDPYADPSALRNVWAVFQAGKRVG
ncbi:MAG: amidohydrolase family protein [Chloroflexi bacterium]|nr:amidohydrolase family protein [Chloroflexota bacterium]